MNKIKIINGDSRSDGRGTVRFVNDFNLKGVKRFYQVENIDTKIIRGFHGHMVEAKYVYVVSGLILFCAVFLDNEKNPSKKQKVKKFLLKADKPQIVYVPPSFANGFKALESDTRVIFFSTLTLKQSLKDDYRFPFDYWGKDVWE